MVGVQSSMVLPSSRNCPGGADWDSPQESVGHGGGDEVSVGGKWATFSHLIHRSQMDWTNTCGLPPSVRKASQLGKALG